MVMFRVRAACGNICRRLWLVIPECRSLTVRTRGRKRSRRKFLARRDTRRGRICTVSWCLVEVGSLRRKELLEIVAVMLGIVVGVWILINVSTSFDLWCQRKFGFWPGYSRAPKSEIRTLFHETRKMTKIRSKL